VCLDADQGDANRNRCTQRLAIFMQDLLVNPNRTSKTLGHSDLFVVKTACRKRERE